MTKIELMQYLRTYIQTENQLSNQLDELISSKEQLDSKIKKVNTPPALAVDDGPFARLNAIFWISLCLGIFIIPVIGLLFLFTPLDSFLLNLLSQWEFILKHPFISRLLLAIFISVIIPIPYVFHQTQGMSGGESTEEYNSRVLSDFNKRKEEQLPPLLAQRQKLIQQIDGVRRSLQNLANQNIVHPDYLPVADSLLRYLERGRADTLKEAINLYEQEMSERERTLEERRFRREMQKSARKHDAAMQAEAERAADATERAADAAERAASWSAASAFITLSEAERQRKRDDS